VPCSKRMASAGLPESSVKADEQIAHQGTQHIIGLTAGMGSLSPNDVLCPLVSYLFIGFYAAFRQPAMPSASSRHGCCSPWCPFLVNVVTI